jgi:glycosyltransferase involved in cell wall biosynthesis
LTPPQISVLIPTYNYARYLPEAIESVLNQTFTDFELIIADDRSPDNTAEVVQPYLKDPRVRFVRHEQNLGMVNNWNYCLAQAKGEYVKYLFGDDKLCDTHALAELLSMLRDNPSATLAASARLIFDEKSRPTDLWRTLPNGVHPGRQLVTSLLMQGGVNLIGEPSVVLFRRSDAARGFDPKYRQIVDLEMWFHLLEKGDLVYTGRPLCGFRLHPCQQTESNHASGIARRELVLFVYDFAGRPWLARKIVVPLLFRLHRLRRNGDINFEDYDKCKQRLLNGAGSAWRLHYFWFWLCYRITKPFHNIRHSIIKRYRRWVLKTA